ncbi:MAG: phosphoribosylformylglycinamidine synthase subunit PurQ [Rhodothalassiaceae bacterium]
MKAAVIVFPGSNCDRDVAVALEQTSGRAPVMVWHKETDVPDVDLIVLPGGFSYGDYLRCGAMAARSPIIEAVVARAKAGTPVLGICNGFQLLTEIGLLPGALMRNRGLSFLSKEVFLKVERADTAFTNAYQAGQRIRIPIAHHDGNFFADADTLAALEDKGQVLFRYVDADGAVSDAANPNGSVNNIAGIVDAAGRVCGLMPHPERAVDPDAGRTDGRGVFESLLSHLAPA